MGRLFADLPEHRKLEIDVRGDERLRRAERDQVELQATSLDALIEPDHLARLVWGMVERFDLRPLLDRIQARDGVPGAAHADPAILVSLWLYATLDGVGSARELARLCVAHVAYRWLCGGVSLNHHMLSDFRVEHAAWLDAELTRSLTGLMASGAVRPETIAQDGLRIRASAGASSFRRETRLRVLQKAAAERIAELKGTLEADPRGQKDTKTRRQSAAERAARERMARIDAALAAMPDAKARKARNKGKPEEARVSTTDAEARLMRMPDGGFRHAYSAQFCVETAHGLVVGVEVTTSGGDQDALVALHQQVIDRLGRTPDHWLVDGGFVSAAGIAHVQTHGSRIYAPAGAKDVTAMSRCPQVVSWRARMQTEAAKLLYRKRAATIEWLNANLRNRGLYAVNVRGKAKVRAVLLWHALAHNLARIIRTPGMSPA